MWNTTLFPLQAEAMPRTGPDTRARRWTFTVPLSVDDEWEPIPGPILMWDPPLETDALSAVFRFIFCGMETCPDTGRIHWQCYAELYDKASIKSVKTALNCRWAHLEQSWASGEANVAYCGKDAHCLVTWGVSAQGAGFRTDLARIAKSIREGASEFKIWRAFGESYLRLSTHIGRAIALEVANAAPVERPVKCHVHWGVTGAGKTYWAQQHFGVGLYWKPLGGSGWQWWDNYQGQPAIILDEFTGQIPVDEFKRLTDVYHYPCQRKGKGETPAMWTNVVITSQKHPREWWCARLTLRNCATLRLTPLLLCTGGAPLRPRIWRPFSAASRPSSTTRRHGRHPSQTTPGTYPSTCPSRRCMLFYLSHRGPGGPGARGAGG